VRQYRSKRNMARHQKKKQNCAAAVAAQISGDLAGTKQGDVTAQRSRSVSRGEELAAIAETVVQRPVVQMSAGQKSLCKPQVGQGPLCASQLGSNPLTLQDLSFPVALRPQDGEFDVAAWHSVCRPGFVCNHAGGHYADPVCRSSSECKGWGAASIFSTAEDSFC